MPPLRLTEGEGVRLTVDTNRLYMFDADRNAIANRHRARPAHVEQGSAGVGRLGRVELALAIMSATIGEGLCRKLGAKPVDVALAWLLRNPVVSTTIVGATTIEELQADLGALTVQLDAEVVERLDQIWPGPGEAPQTYAS